MVNRQETIRFITEVLNQNKNGIPAKSLAREIRDQFKNEVKKSDINPILYGEKSLFESRNYSPPVWFLKVSHPIGSNHGTAPPVKKPPVQKRTERQIPTQTIRHTPKKYPQRPMPQRVQTHLSTTLYTWQRAALEKWFANTGKGIIQAVTGSGKSLCGVHLANYFVQQNKRCLILVPSVTLLEQWKTIFELEMGIEVTSLLGGKYGQRFDANCPLTIGVVNSVSKKSEELHGFFEFIVADECHRYGAPSHKTALLESIPYRLGLTATLERSSDNGVEDTLLPFFGETIYNYNFKEARRDNVIATYSVQTIGVELEADELEEYHNYGKQMAENAKKLIRQFGYPSGNEFFSRLQSPKTRQEGILTSNYLSSMQGRKKIVSENQAKLDIISEFSEAINCATRTLIFCETVESSELIRDELVQKGVSVGNYHSRLTSREQENILDGLGSGRFKCVVAVRALDEGIDVPDIDFGIIISGSRQKRQMIQRMGRVLRKKIDNRNACFAIVYAEGTTEDPSLEARDEGNLSLIIDNADHVNDFSGNKITASSFAAVVSRSIFEKGY